MPSKKANSFIFMAVATVLNIVLLLAMFVLGIVILSYIPIQDNPTLMMVGIGIVFLVAMGLSFVIYSKILGWAVNKFDLENKMDPLFSGRKRKKKVEED